MRASLLFAGCEVGMPLVGLAVGVPLGYVTGAIADDIAIAILIAFGAFTLLHDDDQHIADLAAVQAFALSQIGLRLGARISEHIGDGADRLAGIALTLIGVVLLVEKLAAA